MLVERYRPILYLQYLLLCVDIFMNTFTELLRIKDVVLLVLYVVQDICLVFSVIIIFLLFFNTFIFQAGLVSILISKFKVPITISFIYFSLCLGLHIWIMEQRWNRVDYYMWSNNSFQALFIMQRTCAVFYYYFYKRTALKLGDPRYYQDSEWIHEQFERKR